MPPLPPSIFPRDRVQHAFERTVPFELAVNSLTVIWCALHGHHQADLQQRRAQSPWFTTKTTVTFEDMHAALRREAIRHRFTGVIPAHSPDPQINQTLRDLIELSS